MYFNKTESFAKSSCKNKILFLAFCWIFAIGIGYILARSVQEIPSSLMSRIVYEPVSIVGLAAILFLPVILSALAVRFSVPWFIYLISVLKGVCYGFTVCQLLMSYHGAAWLVSALMMFSDSCMLIPLFFFWVRHVAGTRSCLRRDTIALLFVAALVGCIDYFVISPFLLRLTG